MLKVADARQSVRFRIAKNEPKIPLKIGNPTILSDVYPVYEGPVRAASRIGEDQVLPTALTSVMANIEIERIPVHEVSNPAGGTTVTIG